MQWESPLYEPSSCEHSKLQACPVPAVVVLLYSSRYYTVRLKMFFFIFFMFVGFMYYLYEKFHKPITIQYYMAIVLIGYPGSLCWIQNELDF